MGQIEWAMWANEQAVISAVAILIGGVLGVSGDFNFFQAAAVCIPLSLLIIWMEWPRSKRVKGNTIERRFQSTLVPIHAKLGFFIRNYYFRFVLHLLFSIPCCFLLPTLMGGICLQVAAIIYLVAAIKKEEWRPTDKPKKKDEGGAKKEIALTDAPNRPPPRAPGQENAAADAAEVTLSV